MRGLRKTKRTPWLRVSWRNEQIETGKRDLLMLVKRPATASGHEVVIETTKENFQ